MSDREFEQWLRAADRGLAAEINDDLDLDYELRRVIRRAQVPEPSHRSGASTTGDDDGPDADTHIALVSQSRIRAGLPNQAFWLQSLGIAAGFAACTIVLFTLLLSGDGAGVNSANGTPSSTGVVKPLSGGAPNSGPVPDVGKELTPAEIVLLIDESSRVTENDLAYLRNVAIAYAQTELSSASRMSVIGFGSRADKPAVDEVCPPRLLSSVAAREQIAQCVGGLHRRTATEGSHSDYAAALAEAVRTIRFGNSQKRVFLLTGGRLDVRDSAEYGQTLAQRNKTAGELIDRSLATAREEGIEIWPLGFGSVDRDALNAYAAGGFQGSCSPNGPKPRAVVVPGSAELPAAMLDVSSASRCTGGGPAQQANLDSGSSLDLTVTVPGIATDGSITAFKGERRVGVSYFDPQGRMVATSDRSATGSFELSGAHLAVETLRVGNPEPGVWKVRFTSPTGTPTQPVLTALTWRSTVRTAVTVNPPSPVAGQLVTVSTQLLLHNGKPLTSAELPPDLGVTAEISGDKLSVQSIALERGATDGTFTGQFLMPAGVTGPFTIRGRVSGSGITTFSAPALTMGAAPTPLFRGTATILTEKAGTVTATPGQTVPVRVTVENDSGQQQYVRVELWSKTDASPVLVDAVVHGVEPGISSFDVLLRLSSDVPLGQTTGRLSVTSGLDPHTVIHDQPLSLDIGLPTPQQPFPWLLMAAAALAAILLAAMALMFLRWRPRDVAHLRIGANRTGHLAYLATGSGKATKFRFTVDTQGIVPWLDEATADDPEVFTLTRSRTGLRLRTPGGDIVTMQPGEEVNIAGDLTVVVTASHTPVGALNPIP